MIRLILILTTAFFSFQTEFAAAAAAADRAIALALKVDGQVQLRRAGTDSLAALKFGTPLDNGDWLRTGPQSYAILIFTDDKSQLKLAERTEVVIEGKRDAESNIAKRVSMEVGQLLAKVERQRGSLQIATPTSVASVKGTEFWVVVLDDGTTQVVTLEGLVELVNRFSGRIVDVRPGQTGKSTPEGDIAAEPTQPEDVPEDPAPGFDVPQRIEIEVQDRNGRPHRIIIQYQENQR